MSHYRKRDHRDPERRDRYHTLSQRDGDVHALIKATLNQWRAPRPRVPKTSLWRRNNLLLRSAAADRQVSQ